MVSRIRRSAAFTLIELLVVMSIIAVLAGILLAVIPLAREAVRRSRTETILAAVRVGLEVTSLGRGTTPGPVLHPLAHTRPLGTAVARARFVRGGESGLFATGTAVAATGEALICEKPATVDVTVRSQLLLPSDRYAGGTTPSDVLAPQFYGLRRDEMTILGPASGLVETRRLPALSGEYDTDSNGILDLPYTTALYRDQRFLDRPAGAIADLDNNAKLVIDFALGSDATRAELTSLGGVISNTSGTLICDALLRVSTTETAVQPGWAPGRVRDAATSSWYAYNLRGQTIVDGWGREVLYQMQEDGTYVLVSAGRDGAFCWHPGNDGVFQTAAADTAASGDDHDGRIDNVVNGVKR